MLEFLRGLAALDLLNCPATTPIRRTKLSTGQLMRVRYQLCDRGPFNERH
jgi:hypothetical protein